MLKYIYIYLIIILGFNGKAQNLVVNGSFEQYNNLYCSGAGFDITNWNTISSPDYFTTYCPTLGGGGVPKNEFGVSYPVNGNGYTGIYIYKKNYEGKEYIYQQLTTPLVQNNVYFLSFFASRADRTPYAIKTLGAYFSVTQPTIASGTVSLLATPQVENHSGFLTDTVGWTKIEGYFKAQGGEQYITIGNFNSNANTDTLAIQSTNPLTGTGNEYAYYYIDSVSLYDSLTYVAGIKEQSYLNEVVKVYPNPTVGNLTLALSKVEGTGQRDYMIKIHDVVGREVKALEYEEEIDISDLEKGIYFLSVYKNKALIGTKKVVKE